MDRRHAVGRQPQAGLDPGRFRTWFRGTQRPCRGFVQDHRLLVGAGRTLYCLGRSGDRHSLAGRSRTDTVAEGSAWRRAGRRRGFRMKILLTGRFGQVGYELERTLQAVGEVVAVDRSQMDLGDFRRVREVVRAVRPNLIVNAAAYTAVDQAEREPALAMRINGEAVAVMADEAKLLGAAMIHYSTDYVFDGNKQGAYTESDPTCPVNAYGRSKLAGEQAVAAAGIAHLILRTSWVYGMRGKNFLLTMLRLAQERDELRIVDDQHGAPTWSRTIAETTALIVARMSVVDGGRDSAVDADEMAANWKAHSGLYHLAAQGQTSWHGFAKAIFGADAEAGKPLLTAIATADYPLPARRPANSVLACESLMNTFCRLPEWGAALRLCRE
ncbi:MAG: dTDP-4-dehydrorhamnose reductase [Herminiimonas sp.]|nr:dTDP-4-dehydrorhamnose reductase [Herminiimonas sp.]